MLRWYLGLHPHVRIALVIAPFLVILGYGLVDIWLKPDTPEASRQEVSVQPLEPLGECRLKSGECRFRYGDLEVSLQRAGSTAGLARIDLISNQHIRGIRFAILQDGNEAFLAPQETGKTSVWFFEFPERLLAGEVVNMRMALAQARRVLTAEFKARP
ncbi:MAG: hypothetical protein KDI44_14800 [Thiothrix sp.]|nr:hypothetical protein [Thiothrix sp.]HPQ94059.1 hypothetical protein [Thiolinea sp.]